jgi:hypothetical protein
MNIENFTHSLISIYYLFFYVHIASLSIHITHIGKLDNLIAEIFFTPLLRWEYFKTFVETYIIV